MKLKLCHLEKHYKQLHVLKGISLTFKEGVYGLVGSNGAGKSTLMSLLVGTEFPESGEILWKEKNTREQMKEYKMNIGYLPQEFGFYKEFTGRELLHYTGLIKTSLSVEQIREQSSHLLELLDLMEKADGFCKERFGEGVMNEGKSKNCQDMTFTNERKRFIIDNSSTKIIKIWRSLKQ